MDEYGVKDTDKKQISPFISTDNECKFKNSSDMRLFIFEPPPAHDVQVPTCA